MADRTLALRELNRATLARQMLLERSALPIPAAIERVVGLQAQQLMSPFVALWTRLRGFQRDDLAALIEDRKVIKATTMRATLHLMTRDDYLLLRTAIQPALEGAAEAIAKHRGGGGADLAVILAAARRYIGERPRTFSEISEMLAALLPGEDLGSMRYTVRTRLPLVQVPTSSAWSYPGNPSFALAESWLGEPPSTENHFRELVMQYLAGYGPASVADLQTWSGLPKLKEAVAALKPELVSYRDEKGRELFDLPGSRLPAPDIPAPVRFLPEYDSLLRAHQNRTRVIPDEHHSKVFLSALRVKSTILVDGFVRGGWDADLKKGAATLTIEPWEALSAQDRAELADEGERLLRFIERTAKTYQVRFTES